MFPRFAPCIAESTNGITKTSHSRNPSHSRNHSASARGGPRSVNFAPTVLDGSPLHPGIQLSTLSGSGSLPTNLHVGMERMER